MKVIYCGFAVLILALSIPAAAEALNVEAAEQDAYPEERNSDPFEGVNRVTHGFNNLVDKFMFKPLAKSYQWILPNVAQAGVSNFFLNLDDINNATHSLLQGKPKAGLSDLGRLLLNTTMGLGGLLDPASTVGLVRHEEDLGQTLQVWGIPRGPYIVLPFLGPSTLTDFISAPVDSRTDPLLYYRPTRNRNYLLATNLIDIRADFLSAESLVFGDRYIFFRDAYLQRREFLVKDGKVEDTFDDF
jgi:phospholipid-binding lipoprotein MlaA